MFHSFSLLDSFLYILEMRRDAGICRLLRYCLRFGIPGTSIGVVGNSQNGVNLLVGRINARSCFFVFQRKIPGWGE